MVFYMCSWHYTEHFQPLSKTKNAFELELQQQQKIGSREQDAALSLLLSRNKFETRFSVVLGTMGPVYVDAL